MDHRKAPSAGPTAGLLLVMVLIAISAHAQIPSHYWTFDESLGLAAADSSPNGAPARLVNGASWVPGKIGGAVAASADKGQYVAIPVIDLSSTKAVTVAFWSNRTYSKSGGHVLFEASSDSTNSTTGFGFFPDDDACQGIQVALRGNVGTTANCYSQPTSGVWHHLAVVFDKSQTGTNGLRLYVDGALQPVNWCSSASTNTNNFGNNPLYFFSRGGISQFNSGTVDDLRIYNSALTTEQIQRIYNSAPTLALSTATKATLAVLVSVAVTPANSAITVGAQQQFTSIGTFSDGSHMDLTSLATWTSSTQSVATIKSRGIATAVGTGSTTIQAALGSIKGSTSLTVTSQPIALDGNVHGVQDNGLSASNTAAVSIGTPSAGDLIACEVSFEDPNTLISVADNQNGSYAAAVGVHLNTTMTQWYGIYYKENVAGSPTTITLTTSQSHPHSAISCQAWKGVATSNSLDPGFSQLQDAVATANPNTGLSRTPAVNGELVIAAVGLLTAGTPTPGVNYQAIDGAALTQWWPEYWIQTTATATAGNFTWPSDSFTDMMAAFRPTPGPSLVSVGVTPGNPSIAAGTQQPFTATGTYSDGSHLDLTTSATWSSSATSVATITSIGVASGVAAGSTTILATSGSISGSTSLTVTPPTLVSIAVTPANASIAAGTQQQYTATGTYSDGSHQNLTSSATWTSSATSVATITSIGVASGVAAGSTTILATSGSISGSTSLTVTPATLVSIAVTPANASIAAGTQQQYTATGTYSDGSHQNLTSSATWTSSATSVATISSGGLATGVAAGSTTIKATSGSISGSTSLTVTPATLVSIAVTPANASIAAGTQQQYTATGTYSDGSHQNLTSSATWTSSATSVATISSGGLATGVAAGSTTILATSGSISGSTSLTVNSGLRASRRLLPSAAGAWRRE